MIRTLTLGALLTVCVTAQDANAPYRGQTGLPNNAAANDQKNTALSGNTPETNSTMQKTRSGNLGIELGWLGVFGLAGLFGLSRGTNDRVETPEMDRG